MKKQIALAMLAVLLVLSLTACANLLPGGKPAATSPARTTATPEPTAASATEAPADTAAPEETTAAPAN